MMERELQRETTELYALPAGEFTAARNARFKALRKERPELAKAVAALPKPAAAAAAVNRLAREEPSEVRALAQSGRALRKAQEAALAGKGAATALAAATTEHRAALERVQREARRLGLSQAVLERVSSTLRAASLDPELQPLLERGLLTSELEAAGFGLDPGLVALAPPKRAPPKRAPPKQKRDEGKKRLAEQRARLAEARELLAEARRGAAAADKELARAEKASVAARAVVEAAEQALAENQAASAASPSRRRTRSDSET